ncbi:50S ribosomal protein L11 methyltransferase [Chthonobacter albigriseus]|uniref:50S ribosomal protein L11 methyltransferase n=1 Tax=Chthonobacter albigriseus TaxID=1683161 RepID=UPI0015EF6950|nr:50S ribosomal protein L11 methyltransferase [Chthonobacter albigriseus]
MPQYQVRISADREESERIARLIEAAFEEEAVTVSWFETPDGWTVDSWFFGEDPAEIEAKVRDVLGSDAFGAPLEVFETPDLDWVRLSLEGLKPVLAGRFVVYGAHDRDNLPAGAIGVEIEANQAFGTGHHPTTWGCLVAISRILRLRRFRSVLDLGTGSAVLAIAVAKLTRQPVIASDIDPVAVEIAAENAHLNGVGRLVRTVVAPGLAHPALRGRAYDLVVANILAAPLRELAPGIRANTAPGAILILSGILNEQAAAVLAAYRAQDFVRVATIRKDVWSTLVLRKAG